MCNLAIRNWELFQPTSVTPQHCKNVIGKQGPRRNDLSCVDYSIWENKEGANIDNVSVPHLWEVYQPSTVKSQHDEWLGSRFPLGIAIKLVLYSLFWTSIV